MSVNVEELSFVCAAQTLLLFVERLKRQRACSSAVRLSTSRGVAGGRYASQ